jgi:hypothetical protein
MPTQQQIYARRRGVLLLALLIVGVWAWISFANPFGSPQPALVSPASSSSATVSAEAAPSGEVPVCQPGVVAVEVMIGSETETLNTFGSDATPLIWYSIVNTGLEDCKFNVGKRGTFFTITSGDQTYWSSKQCDRDGLTDSDVVLPSNQAVSAMRAPWDKVYSSENGCNAENNDVVPTGGATYKIKVEVNGVISEEKSFILN